MRKTIVYLIRHAQVENPSNVCYGRLPGFGLSKEGEKQAEKVSVALKKENVSIIFSSPLLRCRQTARIIADKKIPIRYLNSLTEIDCHSVEGKPMSEAIFLRSQTTKSKKLFPDENYEDVQKRMISAIKRIVKKYKENVIVIVSHADPIICARLYYQKKPLEKIEETPAPNGSATILTFNDKLECIRVDYENLSGAKKDF